jgi:hypothetical protein
MIFASSLGFGIGFPLLPFSFVLPTAAVTVVARDPVGADKLDSRAVAGLATEAVRAFVA